MSGHLLQHQEKPTQHRVVILRCVHAPIPLYLTTHLSLSEMTTSAKLEPPYHAAQREGFLPMIHCLTARVVEHQAHAAHTILLHGSADHYLNPLRMT